MQIAYFIFGLKLVHLLDINVAQCIRTLHGHSALDAEPCYHGYRDYQVVFQISDRVVGKNAQIAVLERQHKRPDGFLIAAFHRIVKSELPVVGQMGDAVFPVAEYVFG